MKKRFEIRYHRMTHGPYESESEATLVAAFEKGEGRKLTGAAGLYKTNLGETVIISEAL